MQRGRARRPRGLGLLPLCGAGALGGLAVVTGDAWLLLLSAACVGLVVGARVLRPRLTGLRVDVSTPPRAGVGERVVSHVHVRNNGRRTLPLTRLHHHVDGLADVTVLVDAVPPGGCVAATLTRTATARGVATQGRVTLSSSAPLGLVHLEVTGAIPQDLVVHPQVAPGPTRHLPATATTRSAGRSAAAAASTCTGSGTGDAGTTPARCTGAAPPGADAWSSSSARSRAADA